MPDGKSPGGLGGVQLVVSSSLSRAIDTADIVFPASAYPIGTPRVLIDNFREVSFLAMAVS